MCEVTQVQKSADGKPDKEEDEVFADLEETFSAKLDRCKNSFINTFDSQEMVLPSEEGDYCVSLAETFWADICDVMCPLQVEDEFDSCVSLGEMFFVGLSDTEQLGSVGDLITV